LLMVLLNEDKRNRSIKNIPITLSAHYHPCIFFAAAILAGN
jgi:hypothetical protein